MDELDTSQAESTEQPAGETTDISELAGLLPVEESTEQPEAEQEAQPEGEPSDAPAGVTDEAEIELDGRKVSVRELKETFSTFTRKTQELAEVRQKTLADAREAVAAYAEQRAQELRLLEQQVDQLAAPGIDDATLMRLAYENPQEYHQWKARLDVANTVRQRIRAQAEQLTTQAQQQREQAQKEQAEAHQRLLQAESQRLTGQKWWNTDFQTKAVALAKKHGIPEQVVRTVPYAGFFEIAKKAMAYDEAMAKTRGGKEVPKPAAVVPGASPARGALNKQKAIDESHTRAKQTGDAHDIGRWLNQVL